MARYCAWASASCYAVLSLVYGSSKRSPSPPMGAGDHRLPHHEVRCAPQQNSLPIGSYGFMNVAFAISVARPLTLRMCCKTIFTTRMSNIDSRTSTSAQRRFKNTVHLDSIIARSQRSKEFCNTLPPASGPPHFVAVCLRSADSVVKVFLHR